MNILQKIKDIFNSSAPTSGGSDKIIGYKLSAQKELNIATIPTQLSDSINSQFKGKTYDLWRLGMFMADYFCNLHKIDISLPNLAKSVQTVIRAGFYEGKAAIVRDGLRFIPCVFVGETIRTADGYYQSIKLAPATMYFGGATAPTDKKGNEPEAKYVFTNATSIVKNVAILEWDSLSYGMWYKFLPFLKQQKDWLDIILTDTYSYVKKFTYNVTDPTAVKDELTMFFDPGNPFMIQAGGSDDSVAINNRFAELKTSNQGDSPQINQAYTNFLLAYYTMLGRRLNLNDKKERNVASEIEAEQDNFDVLENDHLLHLEVFLSSLKDITYDVFRIELVKDRKFEGSEDDV